MEIQRDCFGAAKICRVCRLNKVEFNHPPNECNACHKCGSLGHYKKVCKNSEIEIIERVNQLSDTAKSNNYIDNTKFLMPNQPVAIDVEKVEGFNGPLPGWIAVCIASETKLQKKNRIQVILSVKIRQLPENVRNYKTKYSGLARIDLSENAIEFNEIRQTLKRILSDRMVIGIGLKEDLKCIKMEEVVKTSNYFEFNEVFRDANNQPISLKALAYAFLNKKIQENSPEHIELTGHKPVIDARTSMEIYKFYSKNGKEIESRETDYQWVRDLIERATEKGELPRLNKNTKRTKIKSSRLVKGEDGLWYRLE